MPLTIFAGFLMCFDQTGIAGITRFNPDVKFFMKAFPKKLLKKNPIDNADLVASSKTLKRLATWIATLF
jgi:hypothetical protein